MVGVGLATVLLLVAGLGIYTWLHWSLAGAVYPASQVTHIELPHRLRTGAEHDAARSRNGGKTDAYPTFGTAFHRIDAWERRAK